MPYDVRLIQARLNELGFGPLDVDGVQGPRTEAAIIAFKQSVGLEPRAYVGPITWSALMENAADDSLPIPWLNEATRMKGLHERRNRAVLQNWFDDAVSINPSQVPWCGAFVATVMRKWRPGIKLPNNPLGARNWTEFGQKCKPQLGCVLVFWRNSLTGWAGHTGFYWGEDSGGAFHVLGGNQSDLVSVTRIAKTRLLGARWPVGVPQPGKVVRLSDAGRPLSSNEA